MFEGTPVPRQFFVVTNNGQIVIDWGNQLYQDIFTGEAIVLPKDSIAFPVKESELLWLKHNGTISGYDKFQVFVFNLPDLSND
ncbi:MAG: hypothetical protein ACYDH1_10770 [Anaerolineaceae bacterium]|nr:MAG: hypothetical protein CVU46_03870 [Chloroflexi bacterium HGW-Chloroflexi-8]